MKKQWESVLVVKFEKVPVQLLKWQQVLERHGFFVAFLWFYAEITGSINPGKMDADQTCYYFFYSRYHFMGG